MPFVTALVAAAGKGRRLGLGYNKVFLHLKGRPLLSYSLEVLEKSPLVQAVIVVTAPGDVAKCWDVIGRGYAKSIRVVEGGEERQDSVSQGLKALPAETEFVAVHDAARPLVTQELLAAVVEAALETGAAIAAVPVQDTIKRSGTAGIVEGTVDREGLWAAQTPQVFRRDWLEEAHSRAMLEGWRATDDASLVERCGYPVRIVKGDYGNIKVTTPVDVILATALLEARKRQDWAFLGERRPGPYA
ncbi:MAG: 2-C-methyl-D-erythritol 4-phosphate cytidylyltransferase [Thermanaeromonas sp.]|uniref:2-C-methyl-D-erythritol 4-phosphate cytidylyltransferase n=1 Tax=Thermanaeromonas sp. TaxID=2003697 RepID=UPI002440D449|nr:2-C-methyl-D-erythritol 4-phosphate cytidylyltransferase [Thermanaeromonas sp.]MCG0277088.1 2-C-methyl-D-erythritol 4-phosphate cytidylyltransferase [Thermanaeromonas sp.]